MGTCDEPKGMVSNGIIPTGAQGYGRGVVQKAGTYPNSNTEMTETAGCHKRHAPWCERGRNPPTRFKGVGDFNAEAQRRRVRRGDGRVEHVERVEGESVSQGAPSLRDGAMKSEYSHQ